MVSSGEIYICSVFVAIVLLTTTFNFIINQDLSVCGTFVTSNLQTHPSHPNL
jgi:hypothetical protein